MISGEKVRSEETGETGLEDVLMLLAPSSDNSPSNLTPIQLQVKQLEQQRQEQQ